MQNTVRFRQCIAVVFLLSGLMTVIGLHLRGPIVDQTAQPELFVTSALSEVHVLAWSILLSNLVWQLFMWLGLYKLFADTAWSQINFPNIMFM